MNYIYVEPEVAGGLGERTEMHRGVHSPIVTRLHYQLEGWLGDVLLESFPVVIVTEQAKRALIGMNATGAVFDDVELTVTEEFENLYPDRKLPSFAWLKPEGWDGLAGTTLEPPRTLVS